MDSRHAPATTARRAAKKLAGAWNRVSLTTWTADDAAAAKIISAAMDRVVMDRARKGGR